MAAVTAPRSIAAGIGAAISRLPALRGRVRAGDSRPGVTGLVQLHLHVPPRRARQAPA